MYAAFKTDYPRGGMFRSQFAEFFPPGLATINFCDHVFRTLGLSIVTWHICFLQQYHVSQLLTCEEFFIKALN